MAYKIDKKSGDLIFSGWENGIAPSPHKGIANLQGVNISTETGEIMVNYSRTQQTSPAVATNAGTLSVASSNSLSSSPAMQAGSWIFVGASSITGLTANTTYFVTTSNSGIIQLSTSIANARGGTILTGLSGTSAVFDTISGSNNYAMGLPTASSVEEYTDGNNTIQYRYYVLDINGLIWVHDTSSLGWALQVPNWFNPDTSIPDGTSTTKATGIAVYNGWVHVFKGSFIWCKLTSLLSVQPTSTGSVGWSKFTGATSLNTPPTSSNPHYAIVNQGEIVYTDSNFIGTLLSLSNSGVPANPNLFTYGSCSVTNASPSVFTLTPIAGQVPVVGQTVMFISSGTPTNVDPTVLYYIKTVSVSGGVITFTISTSVGGSAVNSVTNTGTLYVNSYNPVNSAGNVTYSFSPEALLLGSSEVATTIAQLGTNLVIGGISSTMYLWDGVASQPTGFIPMPESNVQYLLTSNIVVYAFVGSKGNIYVTNGSSLSLALTVPDYTAGIPSNTTPQYYEPYFIWGGAAISRGRIWFSVQDQTANKTGNCGGVWSFVPSFFNAVSGEDNGIALRLENQSSYGTYNGKSPLIIPLLNQNAIAPQYFSAWASDQNISTASFGIDATGTMPTTTAIIETELVPIGTLLDKETFAHIEYKVATPLLSGESIQLYYRQNATDAWATCGTVIEETSSQPSSQDRLSGWFPAPTQLGQWFQIQGHLIPNGGSTFSGNRLTEIRIR